MIYPTHAQYCFFNEVMEHKPIKTTEDIYLDITEK